MSEYDDSPIEFPCDFPIKAMGRAGVDFEATVRTLIGEYADEAGAGIKIAESRNGRFVSVTVTVRATSRAQLDDIYRALHAHDDVLMTL